MMREKVVYLLLVPVVWVGGDTGQNGGDPTQGVGTEGLQVSCELPELLRPNCNCQAGKVYCSNLTSTREFSRITTSTITSLQIVNSTFKCLDLLDLTGMLELRELKVSSSGVRSFCYKKKNQNQKTQDILVGLTKLESLDLSDNKLTKLDQALILRFTELRLLNLSFNALQSLPKKMPDQLLVLDASYNRLSDQIGEDAFGLYPTTLEYINLKENPWPCSPALSWLYPWSQTLSTSARMGLGDLKCRIQNTERSSSLMVVMETYYRKVLPNCPSSCSCDIYYFGTSTSQSVYTLLVNCSGAGLEKFPTVPLHTTILDLSYNKLSDPAFSMLEVKTQNYEDITGIILSHNQFQYLDNKLLKMKLQRFLKVDHNSLKEIPYDISLWVQKSSTKISLGGNPWVCSCNSEINNVNLVQRVLDLETVECQENSIPEDIEGYKLNAIDPEILCPLTDKGAYRELLLQLICGLLSILIVLVVSKLVYDYWEYKNKGKLPWIVYKIP